MFSCTADIVMSAAPRCLQRLCKHWSHKFQVSYDEYTGRIDFQPASCELWASDNALRIKILTPLLAELEELQAIVADHVQRMAGEELQFTWRS
jgi:hypothetical protein